jgi:hypothetical protein
MKTTAFLCLALSAATLASATLPHAARAQDIPSPDARQAAPSADVAAPAPDPNAARSVNLWWDAPPATSFVNEVTVDQSAPGSFFMACGFGGGYFGLQEMPDKRRVATFSVWDESAGSGTAPTKVEELAIGDGAKVERFGAEDAGAKVTWPFGWRDGRTYKLLVRAVPDNDRVIYSAYIAGPGLNGWKMMASLRARSDAKYLQGLYSFVEDFRRDGKSVQQARRARFGNGLVKTPVGEWVAITKGRFGADANTQTNIDAKIDSQGAGMQRQQFFSLATGGLTRQTTELGQKLEIAPLNLPN